MRDALLKAEREVIDDVAVDTTLSGSTGVLTILRSGKLIVANVGDSRAVFGKEIASGKVPFFVPILLLAQLFLK